MPSFGHMLARDYSPVSSSPRVSRKYRRTSSGEADCPLSAGSATGSPSKDGGGGAFCCCFRSVRSACRSDLICRISDWISAKKESSVSSLSGFITVNLKRQSTFDVQGLLQAISPAQNGPENRSGQP